MLSNIALQYGQKPAFGRNADIVGDTLTQILDFAHRASEFLEKWNPFSLQHPLQERETPGWAGGKRANLALLYSLQRELSRQGKKPAD